MQVTLLARWGSDALFILHTVCGKFCFCLEMPFAAPLVALGLLPSVQLMVLSRCSGPWLLALAPGHCARSSRRLCCPLQALLMMSCCMAAVALAGAAWLGWVVYIAGVGSLHYACHHGRPQSLSVNVWCSCPCRCVVRPFELLRLQSTLLSFPTLPVCRHCIPLSCCPDERQWHGSGRELLLHLRL